MAELTTLRVGRRNIELTHPDKTLFARAGCSKADIAAYYRDVADVMLSHGRNRALTLARYPDGITQDGFIQQQAQEYFPDWIRTKTIAKRGGGTLEHVVAHDAATLVYLVQLGTVVFHAWLSRIDKLEYPDRLVIDIDPPQGDFDRARFAAQALHAYLKERGIMAFAMATGSTGLHVVVPLRRQERFADVRRRARSLAEALVARYPDALTVELRKEKRRGRVFLDTTRNAFGQTTVMPYSLRSIPGAPVAAPITWEELADRRIHAQWQTIASIRARLERRGDPWRGMGRHAIAPSRFDA